MKKIFTFSFLALLCLSINLTSCNKDSLKNCKEHEKSICNEAANKTNIRITNASKFDMCNIVVNPSGGNSNYGIVESGTSTCYHSFDLAYSFAYVSFNIGDQAFILQPIDYAGEAELGNGKFTYTIDVLDFKSGTLSIEASKN